MGVATGFASGTVCRSPLCTNLVVMSCFVIKRISHAKAQGRRKGFFAPFFNLAPLREYSSRLTQIPLTAVAEHSHNQRRLAQRRSHPLSRKNVCSRARAYQQPFFSD